MMDNRIIFNDVSTLTDINVAISIIVNLRLKYKDIVHCSILINVH